MYKIFTLIGGTSAYDGVGSSHRLFRVK